MQPTPVWSLLLRDEKIRVLGTPHDPIVIDGDANFSATALLEGWPGDGSPGNPYIIDGLDIDLGDEGSSCIFINSTQVSFIIRNCNLTGAWTGIFLNNVTNGELMNNLLDDNYCSILVEYSSNCTITENYCNSDQVGISFEDAYYNIVANNTCNRNYWGIETHDSNFNTFSDNTCNDNSGMGISLRESELNLIFDNICNNNSEGIFISNSDSNSVTNNTCISNYVGISIYDSS
jgi:parallel beta-helix repeat protein